jgi:hypothetical protein
VRHIRARLIAIAITALACQGAALSSAPAALCQSALSHADDLDECCKNLAPGQTCPMHHTTHGAKQRGAGWACVCSPSDLVLASIIGVAGALPEPIRVSETARPLARMAITSPSTIDLQEPPQYPPPRA